MKILVFSPRLRLYRGFIDYPYYCHLNTRNAVTVLEQQGHEVITLDMLFHPRTGLWDVDANYWGFGFPFEDLRHELPEGPIDAVVVQNTPFSNLQRRDSELLEVLGRLKQRYDNPHMVLADSYLGGQHRIAAITPSVLENYGFHAYAQDEAEWALPEALKTLADKKGDSPFILRGTPSHSLSPSPVLLSPEEVKTQQSIVNFFFKVTRRGADFGETGATLGTHTSRGCVFSCNFCTSNPDGDPKSFRPYDIETLKNHWRHLKSQVPLERLIILDELANGRPAHFDGLLSAAEELDLEISFPNGLRADLLKRESIRRLAARCPRLSISAESASSEVRQGSIGKRIAPGLIRETAKACHEEGLPLLIHYLVGYPGETVAQVNETFQEALTLKEEFGAEPSVQHAVPLPGAALHREMAQQGRLTQTEVGDYLPFFHHGGLIRLDHFAPGELEDSLRWFRLKKRSLKSEKVIMNLTYLCNNQCTFCATGNRFKGHADLDYYKQLLDDHYKQGIRLVDFDGGEPTLYPHFLEVLKFAKEIGYDKINLTTNGRLMAYPKMANAILTSGLTELLISFHGPDAETHEHQTQAKGSYTQTLAGIKNALSLQANRRIRFGVNFTLTAHNAPTLPAYAEFVYGLGVRRINVQFVTPFGRAHPEDIPDPADAAPYAVQILEKFGKKMDIQIINLPFCFLKGYEKHLGGDVAKAARTMVFVSEQEVNLAKFLEVTRMKTEVCESCRFSVACDGFYSFDKAESVAGPVPLNTAQIGGRL